MLHNQILAAYLGSASRKTDFLAPSDRFTQRERFFRALSLGLVCDTVATLNPPCDIDPLKIFLSETDGFLKEDLDTLKELLESYPFPKALFKEHGALGWGYAIWNEPQRSANTWGVSRVAEERNEGVDIASVTQIFTDSYIGDFLARRGVLALEERTSLRGDGIIKICDPALGTGHLLLASIDALTTQSSKGVTLTSESFNGFDIDPLAVLIARAEIFSKLLRRGVVCEDPASVWSALSSSLVVLNAPYGSLDRQASIAGLNNKFDIVITNPPYLGRRKLPLAYREFLDREYPEGAGDLSAAFMRRCVELLAPAGVLAVVTSDKWLRLKQYQALRGGGGDTDDLTQGIFFKGLYGELSFEVIVELGDRAFNSAVKLHDGMRTSLLIAKRISPKDKQQVGYVNLSALREYNDKVAALGGCCADTPCSEHGVYVAQRELIKGREVFLSANGLPREYTQLTRRVASVARVITGLQTSDDKRYVRFHWQVADSERQGWRVHCRGGGYARWYGLNRSVINWRAGEGGFLGRGGSHSATAARATEAADSAGWVYSWLANGCLGLRFKRPGWSFGRAVAGGVFVDDVRLVAILNSRISSYAVRVLGAKIQLPEGTVKELPVPDSFEPISVELVNLACSLKESLVKCDPSEAIYEPSAALTFSERLLKEGLLLVVEGALEDRVEQALGLRSDFGGALFNRLGTLAAWYSPRIPLEQHPVSARISNQELPQLKNLGVFNLERNITPKSIPSIDDLIAADLASLANQERLARGKEWLFPATGLVEIVSRALKLHPFDAILVIEELTARVDSFRREVCTPLLVGALAGEVLHSLGYAWWGSSSAESNISKVNELSLDQLVTITECVSNTLGYREIVGDSVYRWVMDEFLGRQQQLFFGASPLKVLVRTGGGLGSQVEGISRCLVDAD